jgi:ATP phosphoribosyltransferase
VKTNGVINGYVKVLMHFFIQMPNLEVWLQRPTDIVRKLCSGDLDLGIVGYDIISEIGQVSI